jgi:hypoxanthine phosphoribosyltransferase
MEQRAVVDGEPSSQAEELDGRRKVLVVDDITDTGQSLKLALSTLSSYYPESIKSVTLLHISHSSTIPDFYAKEIKKNEWSWFIFPWNFREDVYNIVSRYADNGYDSENIQKKMYKDHGIKVKKELIDELTAMKKRKS